MWDGFTDDDIERLKAGECVARAPENSALPAAKRQATHFRGSAKKNIARERMLQRPNKTSNESADIPDNARLSKPKITENKVRADMTQTTQKKIEEEVDISPKTEVTDTDPVSTPPPSARKLSTETSPNQGPVCIKIKEGKNYEVMSSDKSPLDEFQSRHKLMEEQNRRRKELLAKVLADRKKQTHAEARRLQQIQEELQKLDALLSNDVGILRNQIEAASLEFMDAQKRYDKAEKEFLEAKLNLFGKLERKELLTEHLCKIIEQNELRKAKKLSELMDKLDLGNSTEKGEEEQRNTIGPVIFPTLCALDEVSYSACNTLKSRQFDVMATVETSSEETSNSRKKSKESVQSSNKEVENKIVNSLLIEDSVAPMASTESTEPAIDGLSHKTPVDSSGGPGFDQQPVGISNAVCNDESK